MPYPAKTTAQAIITMAIAQLENDGPAGLSMRILASALGITPHALYRYFPDRATLEAAIAAASFNELLVAMRDAVTDKSPAPAVAAAADAYMSFALAHPARYALMLAAPHDPARKSAAQQEVWLFVLDLLGRLTRRADNEDAALALWAFLHGAVGLAAAGVGEGQAQIARGVTLFLAGLPHADA